MRKFVEDGKTQRLAYVQRRATSVYASTAPTGARRTAETVPRNAVGRGMRRRAREIPRGGCIEHIRVIIALVRKIHNNIDLLLKNVNFRGEILIGGGGGLHIQRSKETSRQRRSRIRRIIEHRAARSTTGILRG